jgi:hypothetical protein
MSEQKPKIVEHIFHQYIFRLIPLDNNDLLVLLHSGIKCLKSPNYMLQDALNITIEDSKIQGICLWKNNHVIVKTEMFFYIIELFLNNTNYRIISKFDLFGTLFLRYQKILSLNNHSKLLLNSLDKIIILEEIGPYTFQTEKIIFHKFGFNSIMQIRKNEIICNSSEDKKVYFINFLKGKILSEIKDIQIFMIDIDSFCFINKNTVGMGGDLRDGIYIFDINKRELIYHYKEDWRGYNSLLNLGNNKFLGESYSGRCYGESDDELEDLYCTFFFEYNEKDNKKIKIYKSSEDRVYALKRNNFIKFHGVDIIAYNSNKSLYIEKI